MDRKVLEEDGKWSRAAFRILGEGFGPGELDSLLGITPTRVILKGESVSARVVAVRRHSSWQLQSPLDSQCPMEEHLLWLLAVLEPRAEVLGLLKKRFEFDFFCGFSSGNGQGGFALENSTLARIAVLGIKIELDLYPPDCLPERTD